MDIKEKIGEIVEKAVSEIKKDPSLLSDFKKEPIKTLEKLIGMDLPDEQLEKVVSLVKAKLQKDELEDKADDIKDALGGIGKLFGK